MSPSTSDVDIARALGRIEGRLDSIDARLEKADNDDRAYGERITAAEAKVGRLEWVLYSVAGVVGVVVSTLFTTGIDWVRTKFGI